MNCAGDLASYDGQSVAIRCKKCGRGYWLADGAGLTLKCYEAKLAVAAFRTRKARARRIYAESRSEDVSCRQEFLDEMLGELDAPWDFDEWLAREENRNIELGYMRKAES